MTHTLPTDNAMHIARRYTLESASKKMKLSLARTGSLIVGCGRSLVSIFSAVGRACQMAYVDPYRPPQSRND